MSYDLQSARPHSYEKNQKVASISHNVYENKRRDSSNATMLMIIKRVSVISHNVIERKGLAGSALRITRAFRQVCGSLRWSSRDNLGGGSVAAVYHCRNSSFENTAVINRRYSKLHHHPFPRTSGCYLSSVFMRV
jgi:hypothetical protein